MVLQSCSVLLSGLRVSIEVSKALPVVSGGACYPHNFQDMDQELIKKYLRNGCTEDELRAVIEWFKFSADTSEGRDVLLQLWDQISEDADNREDDIRDRILDKIHHRINLKQADELIALSGNDVISFRRRKQIPGVLSKIAAMICIPVFLFGLYTSWRYLSVGSETIAESKVLYEVRSSADAITKVELADGTVVWLNHKSRLRYPARFDSDIRKVELSGEGYFDVAHNPDVPFVINAGMINIIAHGTEFNVCSYPDDDKTEATLVEGEIEIESSVDGSSRTESLALHPSERAVYDRNNRTVASHMIVDDRYYAWKNGRLVFKNEPMGDVIKKLSRWFNVDIEIKDPSLYDLTYTATFVNETLPQVMELLAIATPIHYSISSRGKLDNDTYTKRKVVLTAGPKRFDR